MKINKKLSYVLALLLLVVLIIGGKDLITNESNGEDVSAKNKPISVFLDDKLIEFKNSPQIAEGTVYVSIAEYSKAIDVKTKFKKSGKIIIKKGDKNLVVNTNDNTVITEDNKNFFMNSIDKGKKTLVPIDVISAHFGYVPLETTEYSIKMYSEAKAKEVKAAYLAAHPIEVINEVKDEPTVPKQALAEDQGKVAYLTFDDGPNEITPKILDVLKEKNVKATFFMLGSSIKNHMDTTKRIAEEGHGLGVHSMTHTFKSVYASPESFLDEMNKANDLLEEATGDRTLVLRAPYGSKPYMKEDIRDLTAQWGYRTWDWNVDSSDSLKLDTVADEVYNQVALQIENKEKAVLLFHDKAHTLEALPRIIDLLVSKGFEIKKIDKSMTPLNFWNDIR